MANDRDCENCIHKVNGACNVWECKFEPKSEIYRPCSKCHNEECVFMGSSDTHSLCEDFKPKFGTWISVSERLPDNNVRVLCCGISKSISGGYTRFVGCCNNGFWFVQTNAETVSFPGQYEVTAWMPLPELYKAEGSDKE